MFVKVKHMLGGKIMDVILRTSGVESFHFRDDDQWIIIEKAPVNINIIFTDEGGLVTEKSKSLYEKQKQHLVDVLTKPHVMAVEPSVEKEDTIKINKNVYDNFRHMDTCLCHIRMDKHVSKSTLLILDRYGF
jgi:hypothetical protein